MSLHRFLRIARHRLRALTRGSSLDDDLQREVSLHVEMMTRDLIADGVPPDEARTAARRAFGNSALVVDQARDQRRVGWLMDLGRDLRDAARMLRRQPGFALMAIASLAIGIGATTAVFGALRSVMFEPLRLPDADRLVVIRTTTPEDPQLARGVTVADFLEWRDQSRTIASIGLSINNQTDFGAESDGMPSERVIGQAVTPALFSTLGAAPLMGRYFTDAESRRDQPVMVIVLSYRLWQRRYGGDPNILTRRVRIDGGPAAVVGVMPADFRFQDRRVDFWVPLRLAPQSAADSSRLFGVVARLQPDVTIAQAQADLDALRASTTAALPPTARWGVRVRSLRDEIYGWANTPLLILQAAVMLVLVMACVNVAGLLLARGTTRQREIAMRVALGAGRGRVIRQMLAESLLLSITGGAVGTFLAWMLVKSFAIVMSAPVGSPQIATVSFSLPVLTVALALSVATGIVFGLAPAFATSRFNVIGALKDAPSSHGTGKPPRSRTVLVALQIAFAVILLVGSALLISSFFRLVDRNLNFDDRQLLTFDFRVSGQYASQVGTYRNSPYFEIKALPSRTIAQIYQRLTEVPGARAVAGISHPLLVSLLVPTVGIIVDAAAADPASDTRALPTSVYFFVTPHFFTTLKATIVAGRDLNDADTESSTWAAVVNETAARKLWPGEDPIGKRFVLDTVPEEHTREVVGVVRDIPIHRPQTDPRPVIYASYLQQPPRYRAPMGGAYGQMTFLIRTDGDPMTLVPSVRKVVESVDAGRPLANVTVVNELGKPMEERRNYVAALGLFALTATMLAAIGVFGVMAYAVSQRTREIGIRRALGAGTREVVALVSRRAITLTAAGLVLGLAGALLLTRLIASELWGVTASDPATFAGVSILLAIVAAVACFVPTRRALKVDPTTALRAD